MTIARREIVSEGEEGVYHSVARCVRRAFLCGVDRYLKKDYAHRKSWVKARLEFLAGFFGVEVVTYAVMSNHLHVILRSRPDLIEGCDAVEVGRRWMGLFPSRGTSQAREQQIQA